jgi:hypothetical protein
LNTTWPFWGASGGADHVFVMMGDHGACEAPRKQVLLPSLSRFPSLATSDAAPLLCLHLDRRAQGCWEAFCGAGRGSASAGFGWPYTCRLISG